VSQIVSQYAPSHKLTTAPNPIDKRQTFHIIHPFHPLAGREYILIVHKLNWGEDRVSFKDEKGDYHCIPTGWTDINPPDSYQRMGDNRSFFRIDDLREIKDIVRKLKK
jgi:hypothetical protein